MQLEGIRVVDLTRILSGPFCSMFLADMGAEVIKIEDPDGGDSVREQGEKVNGYSLYFASFNRNKRSVTLDLRSAEGKDVLRKLIARADVVVNNYRPGVMDKMGFGRDALRALKPDTFLKPDRLKKQERHGPSKLGRCSIRFQQSEAFGPLVRDQNLSSEGGEWSLNNFVSSCI